MTRFFRKTHFWKDKRTYFELDAENAVLERGFPKEGSMTLKIGDQDGLKAAFKMQVDEVRALRDILNFFLAKHDETFTELHSNREQPRYEAPQPFIGEEKATSFSSLDDEKEEPKQEGPVTFGFAAQEEEKQAPGLTLFEKDEGEEEKKEKPALRPYY